MDAWLAQSDSMDADTTRGCTPSNGDAVMGNSPPGSCNGSATASSMQASPLATSREADPTVKPVAGSGNQPAAPSGCNLEEAAIAIASGIHVGGRTGCTARGTRLKAQRSWL